METIKCETRVEKGKAEVTKGRRAGARVPAVLYGKKAEVVMLWVDVHDAKRILAEGIQELALDLEGKQEPVKLGEVQLDPLGDSVLHLDFLRA